MNAQMWSSRLMWVLDFIALLVLAGTGEVRLELFALLGALWLLSRSRFVRIPESFIVATLVVIVLAAAGAWLRFRFHPIVAASYAAPLIHSVLWFAPNTGRYRGWRLGVGFVELILSAALAPEFYLFPAIICFVLVGAMTVSCAFLDAELQRRAPENRGELLPKGYIGGGLKLASLIFLSSVIIFPILPRMNRDGGGGFDSFKVGYTERVELGEKGKLNGREGTGEPVLRLYSQSSSDLVFEIFQGLIRGRALDLFDGSNWMASSQREALKPIRYAKPSDLKQAIHVEVVRAAMSTSSLPVPYGAIQVSAGSGVDETPFPRSVGGEWVDEASQGSQVRYAFSFFPYRSSLRQGGLDEDRPIPSDLRVPEVLKNDRTARLTRNVFGEAKGEAEKIERLSAYFMREHFTASLGESEIDSDQLPRNRVYERLHPIERFLLVTKEGHCEWFASASAVMLRLAGVPARLVAGFRVSKGAVGGVLTLTTHDAHAWVEYWNPSKGWVAFDPTPRLLRPPSLINYFRDGYEWVSAYWYRYVLKFSDRRKGGDASPMPSLVRESSGESSEIKRLQKKFQAFFDRYRLEIVYSIGSLFVLALALYAFVRWRYPWVFSIRHRVREGDAVLRRERIKMERLLSKQDARHSGSLRVDGAFDRSVQAWQDLYQELRFGRSTPEARDQKIQELRRRYRSCSLSLSQ